MKVVPQLEKDLGILIGRGMDKKDNSPGKDMNFSFINFAPKDQT